MITLHTTYGAIELELDHENAPQTAANFEAYARDGFYDGTIFHRVIDGFMVQGGGFDTAMEQKESGATIQNEANNGLKNQTGTVAMARTMDPHSASAQFFVNVADNNFLDHRSETSEGWGYAVFGRVSGGMDVVNKIKAVATGSRGGHQDVPTDNVIIDRVEIS